MVNLAAIQANAQNFQAYLTTPEGQLGTWHYLTVGLGCVLFLVLLLLILYAMKSGQMHRERKRKEEIATLIAHLCEAYDRVEELDLDNKTATVYSMQEGEVNVETCPLESFEAMSARLHPDDSTKYSPKIISNIMERVMKTCTQEELIVREKTEQGTYEWMSYLFQGIRRDNQYHRNCLFLKHSVDLVKSKELEQREQLQKALAMAKEAAEAKGQFMSRLSHEIRVPLDAIVGYLSLASDETSTAKINDYIDKSNSAAQRLLDVINDVLDISALENGDMVLNSTLFDFKECMEAINNMFTEQAKQKNIGFTMAVKDVDAEYVVGDKLRTSQVLINILSNAIKFTPAGGQVSCLVKQKEIKNKKVFMQFEISDTGKGIPKEYLQKIFVPFEQKTNTAPGEYSGTGLGLAITHNLVSMLGGVMTAASTEGEGTVFKLELPFEYKPEHNRNLEQIQKFPFVKAIVVDDQENSCRYLAQLLHKFNAEVAIATSAETALKLIREAKMSQTPFNLCLLDWKMPNMDGLELAKKLQELPVPELKVVMVTGYDFSTIKKEAAEVGIIGLFNKPLFASNIFSILMENFREQVTEKLQTEPRYDFKGQHILVAEDNDINAEIIVRMLENVNFKVDRVTNGKDACQKFGEAEVNYYGAILMDIQMPEIDGCEAAKLIRMSDHPEGQTIPIIAMTDNVLAEDVAKAISSGMNSHLDKPINKELLYSTLKNFMK